MIAKIRKWLYSYPDPNNFFGCHIRECFQILYPCKHVWIYNKGKYRRKCEKCWKQEHLVLLRYGSMRWEWCNLPITYRKSYKGDI